MSDRPLFESLEGLRGTGKSTVAPLLAAAREGVTVPTVPLSFQALRRELDHSVNVDARMCFFLSAMFTAVENIQRFLHTGIPVVVESYFARCLANHHALGARLRVTLPPDLPRPVTYHLVCSEDDRQRRLATRGKMMSYWDIRGEEVADRIIDAYAEFPMHRIDTSGLTPHQVVQAILATDAQEIRQGASHRADPKPVGAHPHVLPPVPRGTDQPPQH